MAVVKTKEKQVDDIRYTKEQLLKAKRFRDNVDILNVVLDEYSVYTVKETEKLIIDFLRGKLSKWPYVEETGQLRIKYSQVLILTLLVLHP